MADDKKEHATLIVGATMTEIFKGALPNILLGCDVHFDREAKAWRAEWGSTGLQFGESKSEAILNALREQLGVIE